MIDWLIDWLIDCYTEVVLFSIFAFQDTGISQVSVETHLRCGGIFSDIIIRPANFLLILKWNNFENRLIFGKVKAYKNCAIFFGPPCIICLDSLQFNTECLCSCPSVRPSVCSSAGYWTCCVNSPVWRQIVTCRILAACRHVLVPWQQLSVKPTTPSIILCVWSGPVHGQRAVMVRNAPCRTDTTGVFWLSRQNKMNSVSRVCCIKMCV